LSLCRCVRSVARIKIAIIGAGQVGRTLGAAWSAAHDVTYGLRSPADPKYADLGTAAATNAAAATDADAVVLCTPWHGTQQAVVDCGNLAGKVVIDCTNPLTPDFAGLELGQTTSGGEQVAAWAPGARVCKAMNQIGAPMMDHPQVNGIPVMFVCGDDEAAKQTTIALVSELGFEVIDAGGLALARLLEPYGLLWIHLALRRGLGTGFAFGLLKGTQ
jgi:8-hydroxy-5-deazaflavin:NADPH oxidoreductase